MSWICPDTKETVPGEFTPEDEDNAREKLGCYKCKLNCGGAKFNGSDEVI